MEVLGLAIAIGVMLIVIIRRQFQQNKIRTQSNLEQSAEQIKLQLEEVADNVIQRIDNRINHLELLIKEADDKINLLNESLPAVDLNKLKASNAAEVHKKAVNSKAEQFFGNSDTVADNKIRRKAAAKRLVSESKTNQLVMDLLNSGHALDDISRKTGIGKGAILLIKEMHKS